MATTHARYARAPQLDDFLAAHAADARLLPANDAQCARATDVKTLVFTCDGPDGHALAILADVDRVDEERLAAALGVRRVALAPRKVAEELTGFEMGTLPPCGSRCAHVPTVIDAQLASCARPLVAGGGRTSTRLVVACAAELSRLASAGGTRAIVAPIAMERAEAACACVDIAAPDVASVLRRGGARELPAVDVDGARVQLWGIVVAKRPMARTLCFVTLLPHPSLLPPHVRLSYGWDAPRALWRPVGCGIGRGALSVGVQLVLGRSLEGAIGASELASLIRELKVGSELLVVAAPANSAAAPRHAAPATALRRTAARVGEWWARRRARARALSARQVDLKVLEVVRVSSRSGLSTAAAAAPAANRLAPQSSGALRARAGANSDRTARTNAAPAARLTLPPKTRFVLADDAATATEAAVALDAIVRSAEDAATRGAGGDTGAGIARARRSPPHVLGVDVEWQPERRDASGVRMRHRPALLQLATRDTVLLIDLLALCVPMPDRSVASDAATTEASGSAAWAPGSTGLLPAPLSRALARALNSDALVKLGLGGGSDLRRLHDGYPDERAFAPAAGSAAFVDVAELARALKPADKRGALEGLAKLSARLLGVALDKRLQCAPWGARPLSPSMLEYAALDAHVLTSVYDRLLEGERSPAQPTSEPDGPDGDAQSADDGECNQPLAQGEQLTRAPALAKARPVGNVGASRWRARAQLAAADSLGESAAHAVAAPGAAELKVHSSLPFLLEHWLGCRVPRSGPAGAMHAKDAALLLAAFPAPTTTAPAPSAWPLSAELWVPPAASVRAYDRRSGLVEMADALAIFVSFPPSAGRTYFDRKYPNALSWATHASASQQGGAARVQRLELAWWLPAAVGAGHPLYGELVEPADGKRERLLFARIGRGSFVLCGRLRFARHLDPERAGERGGGIAWALEDAHKLCGPDARGDGAFAQILRVALRPAESLLGELV
ncbi:hypothetical protein KFE25_003819 [Diacronema lutheri]|uniref:3'-5' exonuclease domain-containing protein n=1 Tax=Diacronema lutheri TaxID=2081491 RepID=A0A8J5XDF6_DIALT|nr:hypothetical protein KFE25_003819 [Diacronema lutheri]